jgi:hypothetical protein
MPCLVWDSIGLRRFRKNVAAYFGQSAEFGGQAQSEVVARLPRSLLRLSIFASGGLAGDGASAHCVAGVNSPFRLLTKAVRPMAANMKGLKLNCGHCRCVAKGGRGLDAHMVVGGTPGKIVEWLKRKVLDTKH